MPAREGFNIDEYIGEQVRFFRIASGMKQKDLSAKLGVSYQQVQKYETGKDKISIGRLMDISDVLGVSIINFFEDIASEKIDYDRQTLGLMKYFSDIGSERKRQIIVDIVKIISEMKD